MDILTYILPRNAQMISYDHPSYDNIAFVSFCTNNLKQEFSCQFLLAQSRFAWIRMPHFLTCSRGFVLLGCFRTSRWRNDRLIDIPRMLQVLQVAFLQCIHESRHPNTRECWVKAGDVGVLFGRHYGTIQENMNKSRFLWDPSSQCLEVNARVWKHMKSKWALHTNCSAHTCVPIWMMFTDIVLWSQNTCFTFWDIVKWTIMNIHMQNPSTPIKTHYV